MRNAEPEKRKADTAKKPDAPALLKAPLLDGSLRQVQEELRKAAVSGDCAMAMAAIKNGADVNFVYEEGRTALMKATLRGHVEMMTLLLDAGAQGDNVDDHKYTALSLARSTRTDAATELLKKRGITK